MKNKLTKHGFKKGHFIFRKFAKALLITSTCGLIFAIPLAIVANMTKIIEENKLNDDKNNKNDDLSNLILTTF